MVRGSGFCCPGTDAPVPAINKDRQSFLKWLFKRFSAAYNMFRIGAFVGGMI